jgi:hypothetical protein
VLDPYRRTYWRHVEQFGSQPGGKVFIDKMPLNSILLCLVARLFPAAKILFAVRDPRDVVLSCFRRRFGMTPQMYELLTLEGAARYYDRVMTLAQLYREKLPLQVHQVRYESMVSDWESETQRVCAFLEIPFDNSMRKFAAHARANDVATPSAAQVARGIYTYGVGQWRRYGEQLQPIMPMLAPWVRHFGYEES